MRNLKKVVFDDNLFSADAKPLLIYEDPPLQQGGARDCPPPRPARSRSGT
jgi:hypothetical protein